MVVLRSTIFLLSVKFIVSVHRQLKRQHSGLPQMESLSRFSSIPVVETGIKTAGSVYERVKTSNGLLTWGFETAESLTYALIDSLRPATKMIQGPLHQLDSIMCKSLDLVEQKVPSMYLPPEMVRLMVRHERREIRTVLKLRLCFVPFSFGRCFGTRRNTCRTI